MLERPGTAAPSEATSPGTAAPGTFGTAAGPHGPLAVRLEVSRLRLLTPPAGNLLATCTVGIVGLLEINGVKVLDGRNGRWVAMPSEKGKDGQHYARVFITNKELQRLISTSVLKAFDEHIALMSASAPAGTYEDPAF